MRTQHNHKTPLKMMSDDKICTTLSQLEAALMANGILSSRWSSVTTPGSKRVDSASRLIEFLRGRR
jgi:hypothetical protein